MKFKRIPDLNLGQIMKFCSKIDTSTTDPNGCYEFAKIGHRGYGVIIIKSFKYLAHRISYYLANPLWDQQSQINHRCNNPKCCRVDHLYAGTPSENNIDAVYAGTNPNLTISIDQARLIKGAINNGLTNSEIVSLMGVKRNVVNDIRRGHTWSHLHPKLEPGTRRAHYKLSPKTISIIETKLRSGMSGLAIARELKLNRNTVGRVKKQLISKCRL